MELKKIYRKAEALVSDGLIGSSDAEINKALPEAEAGMVIYTAGHAIEKQKGLDGSWVTMASGGSAAGKDGITPKLQKSDTAIQVSYDNGSSYEDLVQLADLKGEKGDAGKDGAKGTDGKAGAAGTPGKDGVTPKLQKTETAIQVSYNNGDSYEDLIQLSEIKGDKGEAGAAGSDGKDGAAGANGKDGKSVTAVELKTDGDGKIIGGTVTFSDLTSLSITITTE